MNNVLLNERVRQIKEEFSNTFYKWAVMRDIFRSSSHLLHDEEDYKDDKFIKIGYNNIILRGFFIENKGDTYYDHIGLGLNYGKGLALGEARYIINNFIDSDDSFLEVTKKDIFEHLSEVIKKIDIVNNVILTHPINIPNFVGESNFILENVDFLWGHYCGVPLYWTTEMSQNKYYLINKNIGKIVIKNDINLDISEIDASEYENIIENNPNMIYKHLEDYVRVKANEVMLFDINQDYMKNIIEFKRQES
jgi:hypothetical protein